MFQYNRRKGMLAEVVNTNTPNCISLNPLQACILVPGAADARTFSESTPSL
jgi:hypothetical protein